jgi:hypothetical protein
MPTPPLCGGEDIMSSSSEEEKASCLLCVRFIRGLAGCAIAGFLGCGYLVGENISLGDETLVGENVTLFYALVLGETIP